MNPGSKLSSDSHTNVVTLIPTHHAHYTHNNFLMINFSGLLSLKFETQTLSRLNHKKSEIDFH